MFVWCMLTVLMDCSDLAKDMDCMRDTSVRGKVMRTNDMYYLVDFSAYANKQGYKELNNPKMVDRNSCIKD